MVTVTIFYPNTEGSRFDFEYYLNSHMPMSREKLGKTLKSVSIERGLNGGMPESKPPYLVITRLEFDSITAFYAAFLPCADALRSDIPNYTNVEPVIQIGEVSAL